MTRRSRHPLPGWRQGAAPPPAEAVNPPPPPAPELGYIEGDFSIDNADHMLMVRVASWVRRRYGIPSGIEGVGRWNPQHDAMANEAYRRLKSGKGLPDYWR